jgi:hypothetical protein
METLGLLIPHNFNEVSSIFYVVKNAIQRTSVWYNGDLCGSCVIAQTKLHVSENTSWF